MNSFYEKTYQLRNNDFDRYDRIYPSAILDLFQTIAGEHAILLDVGYDRLSMKNLAWVMTKVKFLIIKNPSKFSEVKVKTWPLKNGRVTFEREYIIYDNTGEILIKGSSEWVTIDTEKRKISAPGKLYNLSEDEFISEKNFKGKFLKVPPFDADKEASTLIPKYTDFDINNHVNNTKYADYILNALPDSDAPLFKEMQIDYHLEIRAGDKVSIFYKNTDGEILISGKNSEGQMNFSAILKVM